MGEAHYCEVCNLDLDPDLDDMVVVRFRGTGALKYVLCPECASEWIDPDLLPPSNFDFSGGLVP